MNSVLLKDQFPMVSAVDADQIEMAKKNNIPLFKGVLYKDVDDGYGNLVLQKEGENTVVIGGAIQALEHLCNVSATWKPYTLNQIYQVNSGVAFNNLSSYIALFGVGTGGCGLDFGSVVAKDVKLRDVPTLIPLRTGVAITGTADAAKYYFKKANADGTTFNWYLKEFDSAIKIKSQWKDAVDDETDGTEILEEIYNSSRTELPETYAEFALAFNTADVHEYFSAIGELDLARYNTIGLYIGQKVVLPDTTSDYVNVRLFSYLNFDNKSVTTKVSSSYHYRLYSLT